MLDGSGMRNSTRLALGELPAIGMRMRDLFAVARAASALSLAAVDALLDHPAYEPRMAAFCILDFQAQREIGDPDRYALYLRRHDAITTWDMVDRAAPRVWVEMSAADCERLGLQEGDVVRVDSEPGHVTAPVRVGDVREGTVFAPFHYGSGQHGTTPPSRPDAPAHHSDDPSRHSAANELTHTELDPVSHQPVFKNTPVRVTKVADATGPAPAPTTTASRPARPGTGS